MNDTLQATRDLLQQQIDTLNVKLDTITDALVARKIALEVQEMTHRINIIQSLQFDQASQELAAKLPAIRSAHAQLLSSIQTINNVSAFVSAAATFLGCVDQAIDLARTLMI